MEGKKLGRKDKAMLKLALGVIHFADDRYYFDGGKYTSIDVISWLTDLVLNK